MTILPPPEVNRQFVAETFARFRGRYGHTWTSRATCDEDWEFIMDDWLQELSKFTIEQLQKAITKTLVEFREFPPTLAQLIDLCMAEAGFPSEAEILRKMVARDFSHPMVKMVYDKIGSWMLSNGKTEEIERKVKEHYQLARSEFYLEPEKCWAQLQPPKPQPLKALSGVSPIPTLTPVQPQPSEPDSASSSCANPNFQHFPKGEITYGHRDFNQHTHDQFRKYLISISETQTIGLPTEYIYWRTRFLMQEEFKAQQGH